MFCCVSRSFSRLLCSVPPQVKYKKLILAAIEKGDDHKVLELIRQEKAMRTKTPLEQKPSGFSGRFRALDKISVRNTGVVLFAAGSCFWVYTQVNPRS